MLKYTPYDYFRAAFIHCLSNLWKDGQKVFAARVGYSQATISEVKNGKADASLELQLKICEVFDISYENMLKIGRDLLDINNHESLVPELKKYINTPDNRKTVIQFPQNGQSQSPSELRLKKMQENLVAIFNSGEVGLIGAIEANLVSFREAVELKKTVTAQGKQLAQNTKDKEKKEAELKSALDRIMVLELKSE